MSEQDDHTENTESTQTSRAQSGRTPQRSGKSEARAGLNLSFDSAATSVPVGIVEGSPTLLVVAVEDLCWRLAVQDWCSREPQLSDKDGHAAWQSEARHFNDKRRPDPGDGRRGADGLLRPLTAAAWARGTCHGTPAAAGRRTLSRPPPRCHVGGRK